VPRGGGGGGGGDDDDDVDVDDDDDDEPGAADGRIRGASRVIACREAPWRLRRSSSI
jgi:hypothetical protein